MSNLKNTAGMYADIDVVFRELFRLNMLEYYTCLPCTVVVVNYDDQTVDIQPVLKSYLPGQDTNVSRPIIKNVPFQVLRAGDSYITLPIKPGDTGIAVFCQRDISNWKVVGGEVPLNSTRILDYNDAVFFPYVGPTSASIKNYNPDNIEIVKNGKKIVVEDGTLDATGWTIKCKSLVATEECEANSVKLTTHVHPGVFPGESVTGTPVVGG